MCIRDRDNPHGIENWSTVPNTINEMLCMGHQDLVRVFPVWPRDKDASFHQIRVEGAFLVSSELKSGEVTSLAILSEQGRPLNLLNPWKQKKVRMKVWQSDRLLEEKELEGEIFHMETLPGASYSFIAVSYTHLDVYKRQVLLGPCFLCGRG